MRRIKLTVPRRDVRLIKDLLHLNGLPSEVFQTQGEPSAFVVSIPEELFLPEQPEEPEARPPLRLVS